MATLLAVADDDPYSMTAEQRAQVLAYSRAQAELTRPLVDEAWNAVAGKYNWVADGSAGGYEAAVRAHGEHVGRAVTMTALNRIEAAGADESTLTAAGAFDGDDWAHRGALIDAARTAHRTAWRDALAAELPHRSFGNVPMNAEFGGGMTKAQQAHFAELTAVYPDGLVRAANDSGKVLYVRLSKKRAHFCATKFIDVKKSAPYFVDAHNLVTIVTKSSGKTPLAQNLFHGTIAGYSTNRLAREDGSPSGERDIFGVPDTPHNRSSLHAAVAAWSEDTDMCRRYGPKPEVITGDDGQLYVRSKKMKKVLVASRPMAELTTDGSDRTTIHELAHRIENDNRRIGAACRAFQARRTEGLSPTLYAKTGTKIEMATEDSFVDHYVGKNYPDSVNSTEVFSMGMEAVAAGTAGGLTGHRRTVTHSGVHTTTTQTRVDHEHYALIVGLLSTASAHQD